MILEVKTHGRFLLGVLVAVAVLDPLPLAYAWPPLFGLEFTFTNQKLQDATEGDVRRVETKANREMRNQWRKVMESICSKTADCSVMRTRDKHGEAFKVTYTDGWWYEVGLDTCVVEVKAMPLSRVDYLKMRKRIESDIFKLADAIGIAPHERIGGGHFNIGLESAFGGDVQLFRNFLVDQANHPELAWGVLGNHTGNAPPISALRPEDQKAFAEVIKEFDRKPTDIFTLAREMEKRVYRYNPYGWETSYQNLVFDKGVLPDMDVADQRIEVRGVRPQASFDEFLLECELYERRLEYLKKLERPLAVKIPPSHKFSDGETRARFQAYLTETELDIATFEKLLLPKIATAAPDVSKIPYDEVMASNTKIRETYEGIAQTNAALTEEEITGFYGAAFKKSNQQRSLLTMPRIIPAAEWDVIRHGVAQRGRVLQAFYADIVQGGRKSVAAGIVPEQVLNDVLTRFEMNGRMQNLRVQNFGFLFGPDITRLPNGEYAVVEDNVGNLGGTGDSYESRKDLLELLPQYKKHLSTDHGVPFPQVIAAEMKKISPTPGGANVVIVHEATLRQNDFLIRQYINAGMYVFTNIPKVGTRLILKDGNLQPDTTTTIIVESGTPQIAGPEGTTPITIGAVLNLGMTNTDLSTRYPNTWKSFLDGKVGYLGGDHPDFLQDKELSIYYEELTRFFLNEEPILKYIPTKSFRQNTKSGTVTLDMERYKEVFATISRYVIKEAKGLQGNEVWIGAKLNAELINALKVDVQTAPGRYIFQDYEPLSTLGNYIVDLRAYAAVTAQGASVGDIPWTRIVSIYGDGKVNLHQKGSVAATFIKGVDDVDAKCNSALLEDLLNPGKK